MAGQIASSTYGEDANTLIQHLQRLVTCGPWDLDIAYAMAGYGYDAVKWAEGESVLAELVDCDRPGQYHLTVAVQWYREAASTAQKALTARPHLLKKLGVTERLLD
jgi:hypothetical protein